MNRTSFFQNLSYTSNFSQKGSCFLLKMAKAMVLFLFISFEAQAGIIVTGTVTDATTKAALPGVNVTVKGTISGTVTDMNGNYRIEVGNPRAILVFSFIGYIPNEQDVKTKTKIDVGLMPNNNEA
jgi:hypothetical protein